MRKIKRIFSSALVCALSVMMLALNAFAADTEIDLTKKLPSENGNYLVRYNDAVAGKQYGIAVLNAVYTNDSEAVVTNDNLLYAAQITAESNTIEKSIYMPNVEDNVYTVVLGDSDGSPLKILGYITDKKVIPVTGVSIDCSTIALKPGEQRTLSASVLPEDATDIAVIWESSNTQVATVDQGTVTAVGDGTAKVTVTTNDGQKKAECKVVVNNEGIDYDSPYVEVKKVSGKKGDLVAVDIVLNNNPGLTNLSVSLAYDSAVLGINKTEPKNLFSDCMYDINSKNPYNISVSSENPVEESGTIATVYFYAKDTAELGTTYPITALVNEAGRGEASINLDVIDGSVTYTEGSINPSTPSPSPSPPTPIPDENAPIIEIGTVSALAGETIEIPVKLSNNKGIEAAQLELTYDDALTLTKVERGDAFAGLTNFTPSGNYSVYPFRLLWDGVEDDFTNGTLVTLTFTVDENIDEGDYGVYINYNEGNIYNHNLEDVNPAVIQGKIVVSDYIPGDINGDKNVTIKDVTVLRRHIAGGYAQSIVEAALDVNRDGSVTIKDATILSRFIAGGYDIELK